MTPGEYLAVYSDSSYKIYNSKNNALNSMPVFVVESYIHSNLSVFNDPERKKYGFKIVDINDKPYNISCDGWHILSIIKYYYYNSHTEVKISAPDGEIKVVDTEDSWNSLESIASLQNFINQFRGFKDWSYFNLKTENDRLKKENEILRAELEKSDN